MTNLSIRASSAFLAVTLAAGVGLTACSSSSGSSSAAKSGSGGGATADKVDIKNFSFKPQSVTVKAGTAVTWTMQDSGTTHTVTANDGSFDSKELSSVGKTFSFTFAKAGTFTYKCSIHNSMTGTVVVQ
jgi:plastocyanin